MFHCFSVPLCSTKRFYLSCFSDSQRGNEGVLLQSELSPLSSNKQRFSHLNSQQFHSLQRFSLTKYFLPRTVGRRDYKCFPIEPQIHRIVSEMYILKKITIKTNKRINSKLVKKSWTKPDAGFALRFALSLVSVADWSPPRQCIDALQLLHCCTGHCAVCIDALCSYSIITMQ